MNFYLTALFFLFIAERAFYYFMENLNLRYMKKYGNKIPGGFESLINDSVLKKTVAYELEKARFGVFSGLFSDIIFGILIFSGILNIYNSWISGFKAGFILSGLLFFIILTYAQTIINIPFSLYMTFKIENRFGFNTMTPVLWITDFIKSLFIETILFGLLITAGFWIVNISPGLWWFCLWLFFFVFSLFIMYISPYIIEPLFNKFSSINEPELEQKIKEVLHKTGIQISRVFKMDSSKRSRHTNAYFTGIGKVKRIVLFDTIIQLMSHNEILSVLAHEAGHWKKKHLLKTMVIYEVVSLVVFFISFHILKTEWLISIFNINQDSFYIKIILLGFILSLISFIFNPLSAYLSRRNEIEADRFAVELTGSGENLAEALKKLSIDNLSNLFPHPLYVFFHYSHPPIVKRIEMLYNSTFNKEKIN